MRAKGLRDDRGLIWFLLPSALGVSVFFLVPFILSARYAVSDNARTMNFTGLQNFLDTLQNGIFQMALGNTLIFMAICVPLNMLVSFCLASGLRKLTRGRGFFFLVFMLPLAVPSGSVIYLWDCLFRTEGVINRLLLPFGIMPLNWSESAFIMPIIVVLFIWKNAGYNMLLFWAGLNLIPEQYFDFARLEGAGRRQLLRHVTLVFLAPTTFLVLLMTIINSFKSFREIYLLFGTHPNQRIYMLQHYMTSQFLSLNLPRLTAASYILTFMIVVVILILYRAQKKLSDHFS
jgi:multiple sugar transport system permease protein